MKICVCGKGGSGKSTIVALLADGFKRHGKNVVVLDSDESNASLFWMLGFDRPPRPLMDLLGGKKNVQQKMLARFTSGDEEPTMTIWEMEKLPVREIPTDYIIGNQDLKLVSTGKIHQSMEGCACPMGTVTREFLKKLQLTPDEITVVDMEAGIEHFGRGGGNRCRRGCERGGTLLGIHLPGKKSDGLDPDVRRCLQGGGAEQNHVSRTEIRGRREVE